MCSPVSLRLSCGWRGYGWAAIGLANGPPDREGWPVPSWSIWRGSFACGIPCGSLPESIVCTVVPMACWYWSNSRHVWQLVEPQAFVSFASPTGRHARSSQSVKLLGVEEIVALVRRREAILEGRIEPTYARSPKACSGCAFQSECDRLSVRR